MIDNIELDPSALVHRKQPTERVDEDNVAEAAETVKRLEGALEQAGSATMADADKQEIWLALYNARAEEIRLKTQLSTTD